MNKTIEYHAENAADYAWSTSLLDDPTQPALTTQRCAVHLTQFMRNPALLAVATEASSHPTGLESLYAQPWLWAGGGLGNMDECPLQTCVAGVGDGIHHGTLLFATACVTPECQAHDLAADDFPAVVARAAQAAHDQKLAEQYADAMQRMHQVNKFLQTGWTCGEFIVPWRPWPFGVPFVLLCLSTTLAVSLASTRRNARKFSDSRKTTDDTTDESNPVDNEEEAPLVPYNLDGKRQQPLLPCHGDNDDREQCEEEEEDDDDDNDDAHKQNPTVATTPMTTASSYSTLSYCWKGITPSTSTSSFPVTTVEGGPLSKPTEDISFWSAFDARRHLRKLTAPSPPETAVLDGLRVVSMLWIMLGHVMAIMSSTGAGYSNPAAFLPPHGLTNTWLGQLLFSSRLAVDTFLVLSGFLTVHILTQKLPLSEQDKLDARQKPLWMTFKRYMRHLPGLLLTRMVRIMPLYVMCLLFFTQVAPQLGGGPFWYQWLGLLKPCHDYGWTNLLFVNNFWPPGEPITSTCFYHSWYLAVDMQLFLAAVSLVFWYQIQPRRARVATVILWWTSVLTTSLWAAVRQWSVNTFDGAAVARYDAEAYAKPWTRAVAYLTGMYLAMILPRSCLKERSPWQAHHHIGMMFTLVGLACITFGTVFGAYARRPCQFKDWPHLNQCGSTWPPFITWLYTCSSRTLWCVGIGILLHLCLGRDATQNPVASFMSWPCWTPLSHLTFGTYLIHPMTIFIWQLGDRSKENFRLENFGMDYISVGVVSYVAALLAALTVEFPCAALWRHFGSNANPAGSTISKTLHQSEISDTLTTGVAKGIERQQRFPVGYGSVSV